MPQMVEILVPGEFRPRVNVNVSGTATVAGGESKSIEYFYLMLNDQATLRLPTPVDRTTPVHVRYLPDSGNGVILCVDGQTLLEDTDNVQIYPGESMDFLPISGVWRLF